MTVSSFLQHDGGKLHGVLKMFGTEPEPESFEIASPDTGTEQPGDAPADDETA